MKKYSRLLLSLIFPTFNLVAFSILLLRLIIYVNEIQTVGDMWFFIMVSIISIFFGGMFPIIMIASKKIDISSHFKSSVIFTLLFLLIFIFSLIICLYTKVIVFPWIVLALSILTPFFYYIGRVDSKLQLLVIIMSNPAVYLFVFIITIWYVINYSQNSRFGL